MPLSGRKQCRYYHCNQPPSWISEGLSLIHISGTGIEVYATTLHYAPCNVQDGGFQCVVVLPAGTNTDLTFETAKTGEDSLLTAKNKWLIAHEDAAIEGAVNGLRGENITID